MPDSPDISKITDYLYISAFPAGNHFDEIHSLNIRLILSMHWRKPSSVLGNDPIRLFWLPTFDHPLLPIPIQKLQQGVTAAIPVINNGYAVLVHCKAGVHRSVAMACCVLISQGYSADDAMLLVKEKRSVADPFADYIQSRIRKFEQSSQYKPTREEM